MKGWLAATFLLGLVVGFATGFVLGSPTFIVSVDPIFQRETGVADMGPTGSIGIRG